MTSDVQRRLYEHNTKSGWGTSGFQPWELVAHEEYPSRSEAVALQRFLKSRAGMAERERLFEQAGAFR